MSVAKIILLTGELEAPILARILKQHNSGLEVMPAHTLEDLTRICAPPFAGARLLSFCSSVIVPTALLNRLGEVGYNFHPGPPERPGRFPAIFALYENAAQFGITVHEMVPAVDAGPIVTAEWFAIPANSDLNTLEKLTFNNLLNVFHRLAPYMATVRRPLPHMILSWRGPKTTRADCEALCRVTPDMGPDEVARRRRACGALISGA